MEYQRRSLWNRVWENESLDVLGWEEYVRRIDEEEYRPWREITHGWVLSVWKGIQWITGTGTGTGSGTGTGTGTGSGTGTEEESMDPLQTEDIEP